MSPLPTPLPSERVQRVLVIELAGLGDNVHLLPALWLVRNRWPDAELHVMVSAHVAPLFRLTPWVDRVWAYPKHPKPGLRANLRWARALRRERFDVVIDTKCTDRSSLLAWATQAPVRIGRRPADGGPPGWSTLFTQVVQQPYYTMPMYRQKWLALRDAGFAGETPQFHVSIDAGLRRAAGVQADDEYTYIHVSPCTTSDARELPSAQLAALIDTLRGREPGLRVVMSCADNAREQAKLQSVVGKLSQPPWKLFRGELDIPTLAAVLQTSRLNFSGDTGSLHLAMMTGAPAIAWFRSHKGQNEWIPEEPQYRVVIAPDAGARNELHGIDNDALLAAAAELLHVPG